MEAHLPQAHGILRQADPDGLSTSFPIKLVTCYEQFVHGIMP
jgi:hypothetical protein